MKKYTDYAVKQIVALCQIPSPSGFTQKATDYLMKTFVELGFEPEYTRKKSVLVNIGGAGEPLVLAAHVDTLGAMVRAIKSNGRIRHTKIGGYPENNIENENIIVHTRDGKEYEGTAYLIHPAVHVYKDVGSMTRNDETVEIILDEKVKTQKDVEKLGIKVGDFISLDPRTKVTKTGFIKSRHLDDKASAGLLISLAKMVADEKLILSRKVYLLFTTYEEVGHGGSAGVPQDTVDMISVDMGAVGDDLTTDEYKVSICVKDSGGPYDYDLTGDLIKIAEDLKLDHALDIYPSYGSDVEATLRAGYDIRHGLIGPGVFASHGYERTHKSGIENTLKLLVEYVKK
ncbi:MAG: M42 family metallopeptidase [Candidatus Cloacimonadales bacterium]